MERNNLSQNENIRLHPSSDARHRTGSRNVQAAGVVHTASQLSLQKDIGHAYSGTYVVVRTRALLLNDFTTFALQNQGFNGSGESS